MASSAPRSNSLILIAAMTWLSGACAMVNVISRELSKTQTDACGSRTGSVRGGGADTGGSYVNENALARTVGISHTPALYYVFNSVVVNLIGL